MNPGDPNADPNTDTGFLPCSIPRNYNPRMFELFGMEPRQLSRNQLEAYLRDWMLNRDLFYDDGSGNTGFVFTSTLAEIYMGPYGLDFEIEDMTGQRYPLTENGGPSEWWVVISMVYNRWRWSS